MRSVRCASCKKQVGLALGTQPLRNEVFCSEWCANERPVEPMETRNDEWRILVALGRTPLSVAKEYGVSHSQVYRTLKR